MADPIEEFMGSLNRADAAAKNAPDPIQKFKSDMLNASEAAGIQTKERLDTSDFDMGRVDALKLEANRGNSRVTGEGYTEEEKALAGMSPAELAFRYPDLYDQYGKERVEARNTIENAALAERSGIRTVTDSALGAGVTFVGGTIDMGAMLGTATGRAIESLGEVSGISPVEGLGRGMADLNMWGMSKAHQGADFLNENLLSDELQQHQMLKGVKDDAFAAEASIRKDRKIEEGESPTVARLEEIFENLDNSIRSGLDDSVVTAHETLSSIASLGIARIASKPAHMVGGKIADNMAKKALMKEGIEVLEGQTAKSVLKKTALDQIKNRQKTELTSTLAKMTKVERAEWGSGLGIMMGSGAFADSVSQVDAMSHKELMGQSPGYKQYFQNLINQGLDPEEAAGRAKARVAGNAGLMSAVVAGTIAAPTAMISAVGSKSWLQTGSLRDMLASTFVKEPIANSIQEGGAGWATNLAMQKFADETRELDEGVAQRTAQGAVIGAGMAGVLGTPTLAKRSVQITGSAAKQAGKAASTVAEPVVNKASEVRSRKANTATPGTKEHANNVVAEMADSKEEAVKSYKEGLAAEGLTEAEITEVTKDLEKVYDAGDTTKTDTTGLSKKTTNLIKNSRSTIEAQEGILKQFNKAKTDAEKLDLALGLVAVSNQTGAGTDVLTALAGEKGIDSLPENLTKYQKSLDAFENSELVQNAYEGDLMRVFGTYIQSQGEDATVEQILYAAQNTPGFVSEAQVDKVLKDESSGSGRNISPEQVAVLKSAQAINKAQEKFWESHPDADTKGTQAATTRNIFNESLDNKAQKPLAQHIREIQSLVRSGDVEGAKAALTSMGYFAQHMLNKKTAMEESTGKSDVKDYVHLTAGTTRWGMASDPNSGVAEVTETGKDGSVVKYGKGVYSSQKSHELTREADLVVDVYNSMAEAFESLEAPKVTTAMKSLKDKPFLTGKAKEEAKTEPEGTTPAQEVESSSSAKEPEASIADSLQELQKLALVKIAQTAVAAKSKKGLSKEQAKGTVDAINSLGQIDATMIGQLTASLTDLAHVVKESEAYEAIAEAIYNAGAEHISSIKVPARETAKLGKHVDPTTSKTWAKEYNYLVPLSSQIVTKHRGLGSILTAIGGLGNLEKTDPKIANAIKEGDVEKALREILKDNALGTPLRQAAATVLGMFNSSGLEFPALSFTPGLGSFGSYNATKNQVSISNSASPKTLLHELNHSLTVKGIEEVNAAANEGEVNAQAVVSLGNLIDNVIGENVDALAYEGIDRAVANIEEAVAELANPLFVARAAEISVPMSSLPAEVRKLVKKDTDLLSLLKSYVSGVISWFQAGDTTPTEESVLLSDLLVAYASEVLPKVKNEPQAVKKLTEVSENVDTKHSLLEQLKDPSKRKTFKEMFSFDNGSGLYKQIGEYFTYPSKNKALAEMKKSLADALKSYGYSKKEIASELDALTLQFNEELTDIESDFLAANSKFAGMDAPLLAMQALMSNGKREDFEELLGESAQDAEVDWLLKNKESLGNLMDLADTVKSAIQDMIAENAEAMVQYPDQTKYWMFAEYVDNHGEVDPTTGEVSRIQLNENFVDSVVLATVQWAVSDLANHSGMFKEEMETASGLHEAQLTQDQIQALNEGIRTNTAVDTIARRAMTYSGLKALPDAPIGDVQGAFATLAREAVSYLHTVGKLEETTLKFELSPAVYGTNAKGESVVTQKEEVRRLYVVKPKDISEEIAQVENFPDMLDTLITGARSRVRYVGDVGTIPVPTHQLRNKETPTSTKQRKAIDKQNKTEYFVHEKMHQIFNSLGEEGVAALHGDELPSPDNTDIVNETLEGKLASHRLGLKETNTLVGMAEARAEEGQSFLDVPIRFAAAITRVGRTMLLGRATPQGDKLMRHVFLPTQSKGDNAVNLANESSANVVYTALAQGLFDKKIYRGTPASWAEFVRGAFQYESMAGLIETINRFSPESGLDIAALKHFSNALEKESRGKYKIKWNSLALFNLVELANIQKQLGNAPSEGLTATESSPAIETSLYIEQDGINNGAANALMSMTASLNMNDVGSFIRALESAGISFGDTAIPAHELWEKVGTDIYSMVAEEYSRNAERHVREVISNVKPDQQGTARMVANAVDTLLTSFMPTFVVDKDGNRSIDRAATKYRLMERIYGSGLLGSAKADLGDMLGGIYDRINRARKYANFNGIPFSPKHLFLEELIAANGNRATEEMLENEGMRLYRALDTLATHVVTKPNMDGVSYAFRDSKIEKDPFRNMGASWFKIEPNHFNQIANNLSTFYSSAVRNSIENVLGKGVTDSMATLQKTTQVHSNLYGELLRLKIKEAIKGNKEHQYISRNELNKVLKESLKYHPTLKIQDKEVLVAKTVDSFIAKTGKNGLLMNSPINIGKARGFHKTTAKSGRNKGKEVPSIRKVGYETKQLGDIGVAALANTNISIGDAEMMINALAEGMENVLHVYDGINLPMHSAEGHGTMINKAQLDAWFHNPMEAVRELSESTVLLAEEVVGLIENQYRKEDGTTLSGNEAIPMFNFKDEIGVPDFAKSFIRAMLPEGAKIGEIPLTTGLIKDSAKNVNERATQASKNREVLQKTFKRLGVSSDQMAALGTPHLMKGDGTAELTGDIEADFKRIYQEELDKVNPKQEVKSSRATAEEFLSGKPSLGGERANLMLELLESELTPDRDITVITGNEAEVNLQLESLGIPMDVTTRGKYIYLNGKEVIALRTDLNANAETLLHELSHAATALGLIEAMKLRDVPRGQLRADQARAVDITNALFQMSDRLVEGLTEAELSKLHPNQVKALNDFKEMVARTGLSRGAATAEMLAWGRSNRELMDALQDTKLAPATKSLFKRWVNTVEELAYRVFNLFKKGQPLSRRKYVETMAEGVEVGMQVLMEMEKSHIQPEGSISLAQDVNDPTSQKNILASRVATAAERVELTRDENISLNEFVNTTSNVFGTTGKDLELHKNLYVLFSRPENLDSTLLSELSRARTEAIKGLELSDFVGDNASAQEKSEARKMLNELLIPATDDTSGLANFAALALSNEQVQSALSNVNTRSGSERAAGFDSMLTYVGHKLVDGTTRLSTGVVGANALTLANSSLDGLLTRAESDGTSMMDLPYRAGDAVNEALKNNLGGENISKAGQKLKSLGMEKMGSAVNTVGGLVEAAESGNLPDIIMRITSMHQNRLGPISSLAHGLVREISGRSKENANVYDMIKRATYAVDTIRKNFKSTIPGVLRKKFKNLTKADTTALTDVMYQGGITGVLGSYGAADASKLFIDSSFRANEQALAENEIVQLVSSNPRLAKQYKDKAEQLANYVATGEPGPQLLQNSYAIARAFGSGLNVDPKLVDALEPAIDRLVSALVAEKIDPTVKANFAETYAKDPAGVDAYMKYVKQVADNESGRNKSDVTRANAVFGYMQVEVKHGRNVRVASSRQHNQMTSLGYSQGDLVPGTQDMYYYFTKHNPTASFGKGVVQIVTKSRMGVDAGTGSSLSPFRQSITDAQEVLKITEAARKDPDAYKSYIPLYGANGEVFGYDLVLGKDSRDFLIGEGEAFNAIGVWESRQLEEALADSVNQELTGSLKDMWDKAKGRRIDERMFVNISDPSKLSKTERDAVSLIPVEVRSELAAAFGNEGVMVRRDMLMDVIGRRNASVSDFFTGSSDWSPKTQAYIKQLLTAVLGEKAVKTMLIGEDIMQSLTNYARHNIVIASGIVPAINAISSAAQLAANGVPLNKIVGEYPKITRELETFVRNRTRLIELETELKIGGHSVLKTQKLRAEQKAIEAANSKLSIKELIDKGELNTIADLGVDKEDMNIFTGRVGEWLTEKLESLPPKAQEAARIGLVTKDTAYYKAMEKVTLYGDFIPKAILYKHLQAKGKSKEEAYGHITEEFVNYDRMAGRTRGALESVGLLWFFNWKLRSIKIAARTVVNNPLYALTLGVAPIPLDATMAFSENALSRLLTNNWGSSFGLDPILRSYQLNPVAQVLGL